MTVVLILAISEQVFAKNISFFVDAKGSDSNPGNAEQPFLSLKKAIFEARKFKRESTDQENSIKVYVASGIYKGEGGLVVDFLDSRTTFSIRGSRHGATIFDGTNVTLKESSGNSFLTLKASGSVRAEIQYLSIQKYQNGLVLYSKDNQKPISGVLIRKNFFRNIGNLNDHLSNNCPGFGAIIFWNASNNIIVSNSFSEIENRAYSHTMGVCKGSSPLSPEADKLLVHHVYLFGSSTNLIRANDFGSCSGHYVKLRHFSNSNSFEINNFRAGTYPVPAFQNYFSHKDNECANYNNVTVGNIIRNLTLVDIKTYRLNESCASTLSESSRSLGF